ncbi:DUF6650 family protein [Paraburkholderia aspalathi]|uniref:Uncharacterized protein n=1 Tax=Paraburkholderia aspalathi TaxID=1324617 RepID=A0A1I7EGT4_9BURK|nr:DUF6650 family protein [Paraburkholderia aspalathi]SFU23147.1 hypothetical protein SAMN05192563_102036 [Paraburkholderia aspalathi]
MRFMEIVSRITGFSVPVFGIQWNPTETERAVARRVLTFLEDRRVLYVPSEMEVPSHCVESILRIREFLTFELGNLNSAAEIATSLQAMRAACRKFLTTVNANDRAPVIYGAERGHYASWIFNGAVGELRGVFGIHIALLAAKHGLDIEDELATIIPAAAEDE